MNTEDAGSGTTVFVTNSQPFVLTTSNLTLFAWQALTNDPGTMAALYPGLVITSTTTNYVLATNTVVTAVLTGSTPVYSVAGTGGFQIGFVTNIAITVVPNYVHTFANLYTVNYVNNGWTAIPMANLPTTNNGHVMAQIVTESIGFITKPYMPVDSTVVLDEITPSHLFATNAIVGDFFILPAGLCGVGGLKSLINPPPVSTAAAVLTSSTNATTTNAASFTQTLLVQVTNRTFLANGITCGADVAALRQGIDKITLVRRDYDSLLGTLYNPITNEYDLYAVSNNAVVGQRVQRVVTQPDFVFTAGDLASGPNNNPFLRSQFSRTFNWDIAHIPAGLFGPGTIIGPTTVVLDNSGPLQANPAGLVDTNGFLNSSAFTSTNWVWGSFDGTTNPPVIYPNDVSKDNLAAQVYIQITPDYLPAGTVGVAYSARFNSQNNTGQTAVTSPWTGPWTWTLTSGSLPTGLQLAPGGLISGTPTESGDYDFVILVTDSAGRTTTRSFSIGISD